MDHYQEKKNKKIGMVVSLTVHGLILLLFIFLMAWRAPNPPHPEYGIELNFGLDAKGGGPVQPKTPSVAENKAEEEPKPEKATTTETTPAEPVKEPAKVNVKEPQPEQSVETQKIESPVKVEEKPKKVEEVKKTEAKTETKEIANVNKTGAGGEKGTSDKAKDQSHGDDPNVKGDKGNEKGTLDSKALYGTPGGGAGGHALDMAGWIWDREPKVDDKSSETGRIVFEVKIDSEGDILNVIVIDKTVSPTVVQLYEKEVRKLTFSKTTQGGATAATSTGRITFIIRSK